MTKEKLIGTIQRILKIDIDVTFLHKLDSQELETLLAYIRAELDK